MYKKRKKKSMTHPLRNIHGEHTFTRLRLETAMKLELDALAKKDNRSTTYIINEAIAEYLERHSNYQLQ